MTADRQDQAKHNGGAGGRHHSAKYDVGDGSLEAGEGTRGAFKATFDKVVNSIRRQMHWN